MHTIDALRFAAAIGVLAYHWTARDIDFWGEPVDRRFGAVGDAVVYLALAPELFFVVSGFVVCWTAWGRTVPQFVASRLARVLPAYWAALALITVLLMVLWPAGKELPAWQVAVNATLLQEVLGVRHVDGVYWTLWAEVRFYALMAVLVAVGLTRTRLLVVAGVWPVLGTLAHHVGWTALDEVLIGAQAPWFATGMLLYLIHRDVARGAGHRRLPWVLVGSGTLLALVTTVPEHLRDLPRLTGTEPDAVLMSVLAVGCVALVAAVTLTPAARWHAPWAVPLGALTYPLYLTHQFWGWWVISLLHDVLPTALVLAVAAAVALALAWTVHRAVEERCGPPMRAWLERTLSRAGARRPAQVAESRR